MSKKVVTKKKAQPAPATSVENGTPAPAASATTDVRVAHQLRVLETVADKGEEDEKKYSPRTERYIQQLTGVLDFYEYSRSDIAGLVRRCHYDENQIQIAVANIIEDRANHEKEEWGTVKNKKQAKEERKIKEEEEKKEQERLQKEQEKQRRESERKAAKEAREAERAKRGGKGGKNGTEADGGASALPPDPAILFAGAKPTQNVESDQSASQGNWQEQWWENSGDKWNGKSWEWQENWQEDWSENKNGGKSWEWQESWQEDWSGNKAENDKWWGSWEKAGSRKKGHKEKNKDGPALAEDDDAEGDFWDMPDTSAPDAEGGLDRWTLGRLPGHEQAAEDGMAVPKAMPNNALTVEALERDHLAAAPTVAPQVAAPAPMNAPSGNWMVDGLPPPQQDLLAALGAPVAASSSSAPAEDRNQDRPERGEKGRGKGKKGKDREKGAEGEKERLERIDRSDDPRRQAVEQVGEVVTVRKHSSMGCAVVSMTDVRVRQAIVAEGNECTINGLKVQIKPHHNKDTKEEVLTDLFVAWGRQVEKVSPLSEEKIAQYFDKKYKDIIAGWKAAEEERRQAEEQQRQEIVLKQRTEERRRYEEEEQKRRQQEAEQQQKWMSQQWMQQAGGVVPQGGAVRGMGATADAYQAQLQQQQPQQQQQAAAMQWNPSQQQQWMQAMAYQAQGWQMAQRGLQMQGMAQAASGQDQADWRAYYQQYVDQQQRGQNAFAAQQQAGGYQNQQAFNYGTYSRGERI